MRWPDAQCHPHSRVRRWHGLSYQRISRERPARDPSCGAGDLTGTDAIVWRHNKSTPYVPSPLLYGDKLYFFAGNNGILSCFDAKSGHALIDAERIEALSGVYASPVGAGGRVYLPGRNGATLVIKRSDKLEVLATNRLEEKFDASPAVAGNELFLRGHEHLY